MSVKPFYYKETHGIRVMVRPLYLSDHSQPERGEYTFAYFVRIENTSKRTAQLLTRRWLIRDSGGDDQEVAGEGVVGQQPTLAPGSVHEYHSFCVLKSPQGSMEGTYGFIGKDDVMFDVAIPRFILLADDMTGPVA